MAENLGAQPSSKILVDVVSTLPTTERPLNSVFLNDVPGFRVKQDNDVPGFR